MQSALTSTFAFGPTPPFVFFILLFCYFVIFLFFLFFYIFLGEILTCGILMDLKLRDDNHHRRDARDGADSENDEYWNLFSPIHLNFPQHDDGGEQQAEPERDVDSHHGETHFETYSPIAARFKTPRFPHLNEGQAIAGTTHADVHHIGGHEQRQKNQESAINSSPNIGRQPGDPLVEEDDGHLDKNRSGNVEELGHICNLHHDQRGMSR